MVQRIIGGDCQTESIFDLEIGSVASHELRVAASGAVSRVVTCIGEHVLRAIYAEDSIALLKEESAKLPRTTAEIEQGLAAAEMSLLVVRVNQWSDLRGKR
jgi:hypothetical protein